MDTTTAVSIVGIVSLVSIVVLLGMVEWNKENLRLPLDQEGLDKRIDVQDDQLEWCDGTEFEHLKSSVCHFSKGSGCGNSRGPGTRLRYGDKIEVRINGQSYGEFFVIGGTISEELDRNDQFILMNNQKQAFVMTKDRKIVLAPFDKRYHHKISAFQRNNVKGDVSSRIEPVYGFNYLFIDDGRFAQFWVYENDEMVGRDKYELFKGEFKTCKQSLIPIDVIECLLNNLVQVEFIAV